MLLGMLYANWCRSELVREPLWMISDIDITTLLPLVDLVVGVIYLAMGQY